MDGDLGQGSWDQLYADYLRSEQELAEVLGNVSAALGPETIPSKRGLGTPVRPASENMPHAAKGQQPHMGPNIAAAVPSGNASARGSDAADLLSAFLSTGVKSTGLQTTHGSGSSERSMDDMHGVPHLAYDAEWEPTAKATGNSPLLGRGMQDMLLMRSSYSMQRVLQ